MGVTEQDFALISVETCSILRSKMKSLVIFFLVLGVLGSRAEVDLEGRSADVIKNYLLNSEQRLAAAEAKIKLLQSQMVRCESGQDVAKSPFGIWGQVSSYSGRRIVFKKPFVGKPSMVIGVRKAVDDASLKPIWAHVWYDKLDNEGFTMDYLLRPTNTKVFQKTYAVVYWMACGH